MKSFVEMGNRCWVFPAKTKANNPQMEYSVDLNAVSCDCPDFEYRKESERVTGGRPKCKHIRRAELLEDAVRQLRSSGLIKPFSSN